MQQPYQEFNNQAQSSNYQTPYQSPNVKVPMQDVVLNTPKKNSCYTCGEVGHYSYNFPNKFVQMGQNQNLQQLEQEHQGHINQALVNKEKCNYVQGRVNHTTVEVAEQALEVVVGMIRINSSKVLVLFDTGSSHSFIKASCAAKHKILMLPMKKSMLIKSPGGEMKTSYKCPRVKLNIQGVEFPTDLIVLEYDGIDIILGMNWLRRCKGVIH